MKFPCLAIFIALLFVGQKANAQNGELKSSMNLFGDIIKWADGLRTTFNNITDANTREEASDKLKWLSNDIDILRDNEEMVIHSIATKDSMALARDRSDLQVKSDKMTEALQDMIVHLRGIRPLLNSTIYGVKTDNLVDSVQSNLLIRKGRTLSEISQYLYGNHSVNRALVIDEGNAGIQLLRQCKAKLAVLIDELKPH
jgi:hypothetical protein